MDELVNNRESGTHHPSIRAVHAVVQTYICANNHSPDPLILRYRTWQKKPLPTLNVQGDLKEAFLFPLLFAPGEGWEYGVGIDWAGFMVERVANMFLEDYHQQHIWAPLGVKNFSFHPRTKPVLMAKMTDMSEREGNMKASFGVPADSNAKVVHRTKEELWNSSLEECSGGTGGYGAPFDYEKMLHSILADDGRLFKTATIEEMFKPQLTNTAREALIEILKVPEFNSAFGGLPLGAKVDWGLGGIMLLQDTATKKKGTIVWGGYPNLNWFIDRAGGVAGIYGSQLCPPGDEKSIELYKQWEEVIYGHLGA